MTLTAEALAKLAQPLDPKRVKKREGGGGRSLSYLESHDMIRTANEVFGIGGWSYTVDDLAHLGTEEFIGRDARAGHRTAYRATVRVNVNGTEYGDVGYGDATEYTNSTLTTHELASKEAVSDAVKRALRNFGDQFGLCLYDKDAPEHRGQNAQVSTAPLGAGAGGVAAGSSPTPSGSSAAFTPPAEAAKNSRTGEGGDWQWPFGKHKGVRLEDTPLEYVMWYAESGSKEDVKQKCNVFLAVPGGGFVEPDDEGIPFAPSIDGLGN